MRVAIPLSPRAGVRHIYDALPPYHWYQNIVEFGNSNEAIYQECQMRNVNRGGVDIPDNPVLEALDISLDHVVDLWAPRWDLLLVSGKSIDSLRTEIANVVNSTLKAVAVVCHKYADHIVRSVSLRLLLVVREDILYDEWLRKVSLRILDKPTFDQVTRSFVF